SLNDNSSAEKRTNVASRATASAAIFTPQPGRGRGGPAEVESVSGPASSRRKEYATRLAHPTKKHPRARLRPSLECQSKRAGRGKSRQTDQAGRSDPSSARRCSLMRRLPLSG